MLTLKLLASAAIADLLFTSAHSDPLLRIKTARPHSRLLKSRDYALIERQSRAQQLAGQWLEAILEAGALPETLAQLVRHSLTVRKLEVALEQMRSWPVPVKKRHKLKMILWGDLERARRRAAKEAGYACS